MVGDGDDIVSLPSPPPPRPAARREAIEAALRKFDGIEPAPAQRKRLHLQWATMHRRPAGALVAATLIAVIAIPAVQIALRDRPPDEVAGTSESAPVRPTADALPPVAANESVDPDTAEAVADKDTPPLAQVRSAPLDVSEESLGFASSDREEKARLTAPALESVASASPAMIDAPPPPPPPPPPPAPRRASPQTQASDPSDDIVVTGALIRQPNLESAAPVTVIDPMSDFLWRLQRAFSANDRRAVLRLVGFPLRVSFDGEVRTYRVAADVDRDFDRIFTPQVRASVLQLGIAELSSHEGGRLKGNARIRFGCGKQQCSSGEIVRIKEVNP